MDKVYNILIIDDHPLIVEAYKSALDELRKEDNHFEFQIEIADTCDTAYEKIVKAIKRNKLDLVFLDLKLPPSEDGKILSGGDLGIKIRKLKKETKIIVSTTYNDNYLIYNIVKTVNPNAFLIKNDVTPKSLVLAIKSVILDSSYYSKTVLGLLQRNMEDDYVLDKYDRQLLYEISIGSKMKDLPEILPLSIAGIERRKRFLKQLFEIPKKDDKILIQIAKERGFI